MTWTPKRLSADAKRGLEDLYFFATHYCNLDLEEQPHREICAQIQEGETNPDKPYVMVVVPRGCYKTFISRAAVVWKQLRQIYLKGNLHHRIMLCSATLALGETSLRWIENLLRNGTKIKADYGEMWINDRKENLSSRDPNGMVLAPRVLSKEVKAIAEPSFWVGSEKRISTGFHADEALVDDLNNAENTDTDHQRLKAQRYWELIFPILSHQKDKKGQPAKILMNATPWHDDDVGGRIRRREKDAADLVPNYKSKWTILHRSSYLEDGSPYFPSVLSLEALEDLRVHMSTNLFSANYLTDPVGRNGFVDEDKIIFVPRDKFPSPLRWIRATVDPAQHDEAKKLGCYTAIFVGGYDRFANLYILDARGSREWDTADTIDEFFRLSEQYDNIPILVEDVHMAHFRNSVSLEEESRSKDGPRKHLRLQWIPVGSESKYEKWEKMQPRVNARRVFFADEIDAKLKAEIKEELVRGQAARFKDFLDALAMMENGISPRMARDGSMMDQTKRLGKAIPDDPRERTWGNLMPELGNG
jgi:hypothetical protein